MRPDPNRVIYDSLSDREKDYVNTDLALHNSHRVTQITHAWEDPQFEDMVNHARWNLLREVDRWAFGETHGISGVEHWLNPSFPVFERNIRFNRLTQGQRDAINAAVPLDRPRQHVTTMEDFDEIVRNLGINLRNTEDVQRGTSLGMVSKTISHASSALLNCVFQAAVSLFFPHLSQVEREDHGLTASIISSTIENTVNAECNPPSHTQEKQKSSDTIVIEDEVIMVKVEESPDDSGGHVLHMHAPGTIGIFNPPIALLAPDQVPLSLPEMHLNGLQFPDQIQYPMPPMKRKTEKKGEGVARKRKQTGKWRLISNCMEKRPGVFELSVSNYPDCKRTTKFWVSATNATEDDLRQRNELERQYEEASDAGTKKRLRHQLTSWNRMFDGNPYHKEYVKAYMKGQLIPPYWEDTYRHSKKAKKGNRDEDDGEDNDDCRTETDEDD